jgi:hypothetical protein
LSSIQNKNRSLTHFCFKASFKAEQHLIQPGQKDPQHQGQILEFLAQKGTEASSQLKEGFKRKNLRKVLVEKNLA